MGDKRLQKQIDKLETAAEQLTATADELRGKAAAKAERLSDRATSRAAELLDMDEPEETKGRKGLFALLLAAAGGAVFALKRKREQELDEALWEEPRDL